MFYIIFYMNGDQPSTKPKFGQEYGKSYLYIQ